MTDKIYPSSKPTTNGGPALPATASAANHPMKSQLYNPTSRPPPYRHQKRRSRSCRFSCCCCCIWTTICILTLILIAAIVGCALYVLYRPKEPTFSVSSLRVATLNVTSSPDASSSHLETLFNMTITIKNPNSHIFYSYMPFVVSAVSDGKGDVQVGNGTIDGMIMDANNATTVGVILSASQGLDAESASNLESDLVKNKKRGLTLKIVMDTKVKVMVEKIKSSMVGIRVTCDGIKGVVAPPPIPPPPKGSKGKAAPKPPPPVVANVAGAKCKVDLRINIWKFTFTV